MRRTGVLFALTFIFLIARWSPAEEYAVFDIVGDSVSAGANPDFYSIPAAYGWAQILFGEGGCDLPPPVEDTIQKLWPDIQLYNSSVSGSKASDWVSTRTSYLPTVLNQHNPDLVVVMIGGNDFIEYGADGLITAQEFEEFRTNLETIVDRLQSNLPKPEVILVDYYDLADGYSEFVPPELSDYTGISTATLAGNSIIREVADEKGTHCVSIYDAFLHHAYGVQLGDPDHLEPNYFWMKSLPHVDVHPVTEGHRVIYSRIYQKLSVLKGSPFAGRSWFLY